MTTTDTLILDFGASRGTREATPGERAVIDEYVADTGGTVEHAAANMQLVIDWYQQQTIDCPVEGCLGTRMDHEEIDGDDDLAVHHQFPPLQEDIGISVFRKDQGDYQMYFEVSAGTKLAEPGTSANARQVAAHLTAEALRVDMLNAGVAFHVATDIARAQLSLDTARLGVDGEATA